ncbi:hypothetical protein KUTeg_019503 [Tegillarca granosa]|uniref:Uncharacterized protein n=1 Tax=Tegillarca granosa TaxID=220873 RepID=A0ABQ9EGR7_TEGGR|nr:hypothetical protein KUTeg_019503 [Tegillarca granosa]
MNSLSREIWKRRANKNFKDTKITRDDRLIIHVIQNFVIIQSGVMDVFYKSQMLKHNESSSVLTTLLLKLKLDTLNQPMVSLYGPPVASMSYRQYS